MGKDRRFLSKKWLILGMLLAMFPLFQNMSPTDEFIDIRQIAPRKPSGRWDAPEATYFPQDVRARSLNDVQQSLLSHNFDPLLKDLEWKYLTHDERRIQFSEAGLSDPTEAESPTAQWKFGVINPTKVRLSYENLIGGKEFRFVCEAQSGQEGLALRMTRPLTSRLNMGISHETGQQQSQIQMDYTW